MTNCKRCGFCCMSLPNWNDLDDVDRAMIRLHDKNAEELFKRVINSKCPNLVYVGNITKCSIYDKRYNFCKAFICKRMII